MKILLILLFMFFGKDYDYAFDFIETPPQEEEEPESPHLDLEKMVQDFVIETKRISIPGFEDAFNPSIVNFNGQLLMSFRTYHPEYQTTHEIALVFLNDQFEPLSPPQILQFSNPDPDCLQKRQDPRLIQVGEKLYIVYNNAIHGEVRRMLFGEIQFEDTGPIVKSAELIANFEDMLDTRSEKNWVPFDYYGKLHFAESIHPHKIFVPLVGNRSCATLFSSDFLNPWNWGALRGGTPAIRVGDEYLAFFHSSKNLATEHSQGVLMPHYFMGAYTFSATPPFTITRISPEPIVGKNFYEGKAYKTWRPLRVVFPGGFCANDDFIWVLYGRQDHESWVVKLDKKGLMNSLITIQ